MTTARISSIEDRLFTDENTVESYNFQDFEPLEAEFQPISHLPITSAVVILAAVAVAIAVSSVLGWEFGAFLAIALAAKMAGSRMIAFRDAKSVTVARSSHFLSQ